MTLYKLSFELLSPLITPLKGDTIWGHIVWGIANHEGEDAVEKFLEKAKTTPELLVSSAFPAGCVCIPLPEPELRDGNLNRETYAQIKKDKKRRYISAATVLDGNIAEAQTTNSIFTSEPRLHNTIDRYSNTVLDGGLYGVEELWAEKKQDDAACTDKDTPLPKFDLYILSSLDKDRIYKLCSWAFENGYGADASTGKGRIRICGEDDSVLTVVTPKKKGTKYMALAPFVLNGNEEITDLRADIFVRNGKIGGSFSSFMTPYKKTVMLYDEGAVFTSKQQPEYIGSLLTDIHADKRICQSGFAPVIPIE